MTWKDSIKIGVREIDRQHMELCGMLDDFYDASVQGKGTQEVVRLLEFLESYTIQHFADEEKLQLAIGYPNYQKHVEQHNEMRQRVSDMKKEISTWGATIPMVKAVNEAITAWLIRHIMGFDMDIKKYIL